MHFSGFHIKPARNIWWGKHKAHWNMKKEREHEAANPGPESIDPKELKLILESINVTSANSNRNTILGRKAHVQMIQETCLTKTQKGDMQQEAKKV